jgi:hypothetical protein
MKIKIENEFYHRIASTELFVRDELYKTNNLPIRLCYALHTKIAEGVERQIHPISTDVFWHCVLAEAGQDPANQK